MSKEEKQIMEEENLIDETVKQEPTVDSQDVTDEDDEYQEVIDESTIINDSQEADDDQEVSDENQEENEEAREITDEVIAEQLEEVQSSQLPLTQEQKPKKTKEYAKKFKKIKAKISVATKVKVSSMLKTFRNSSNEQKGHKFNLSLAIFKGSYVYNPVLTQVLGVCPIVMLATTVSNAVMLTAIVSIMLLVCELVTSKFLKRVPRWVRVSFYTAIAAAVVTPICLTLMQANQLSTAFSIYLPLVSVNGMLVIRCEKFACKTSVKNSFFDAIATSIGFGFVAVIVGAIREIFVSGSLLGFTIAKNIEQLPSNSMAFITLVLLGFFSAIHKWSVMKYFPDETTNNFDLVQVFEKISFSESGIQVGKKKDSAKVKKLKSFKTTDNIETTADESTVETSANDDISVKTDEKVDEQEVLV